MDSVISDMKIVCNLNQFTELNEICDMVTRIKTHHLWETFVTCRTKAFTNLEDMILNRISDDSNSSPKFIVGLADNTLPSDLNSLIRLNLLWH